MNRIKIIKDPQSFFKTQQIEYDPEDQSHVQIGFASSQLSEMLEIDEDQIFFDVLIKNEQQEVWCRMMNSQLENIYLSKLILSNLNFQKNIQFEKQLVPNHKFKLDTLLNFLPQYQIAKQIIITPIINLNYLKYQNQIQNLSLDTYLKQPFVFTKNYKISIKIQKNDIKKNFQNLKQYSINFQIQDQNDFQKISIYNPKQTKFVFSNEILNCRQNIQIKFQNYQLKLINFLKNQEIKKNLFQSSQYYLLIGQKNTGKSLILKYYSQKYGFNFYQIDTQLLTNIPNLEKILKEIIDIQPSIIHIKNIKSQNLIKDSSKQLILYIQNTIKELSKKQNKNVNLKFFFSTYTFDDQDEQDQYMNYLFDQKIYQKKLNNEQYMTLLDFILKKQNIPLNINNLEQLYDILNKKIEFIKFHKILKLKKFTNFEQIIEYLQHKVKIVENKISFTDIGGLQSAKQEILKTILLPQLYPQIFNKQLKPRTGLLFYGPPGTGKTMLAKCIASQCSMHFISVKGPEMLNMYVGESEKNIRKIFQDAREKAPSILFFDELDALVPKRGSGSDSSKVMDRIVAQFVTELDQNEDLVFIIGATNRPDLLDQSLLRPGRFDKMVYLGICQKKEQRINILKAQLRKFDHSINFESIIDKVPINFTGADFYGVTQSAIMIATKRRIEEIEEVYQQREDKNIVFQKFIQNLQEEVPEIKKVKVENQDLLQAIKECKPSVSLEEMQKYQRLQKNYQN